MLAVLLVTGLCVQRSAAQSWRAEETLYLRPKLGLNTYGGDWARGPALLEGPPGPSTGLEVGYRRRMGAVSGALGGYFMAGRYPSIARGAPIGNGALVSELEQWRHTVGLVGQIGFAPESRLNPYVQLGAGATVGNRGEEVRAAFSPLGGAGLDVALTDQIGLFVEATGIVGLPDRGLDGRTDGDSRSVDWFSFLGAGVRIDLGSSFIPVNVRGIDGPTRLRPGEPATFTALTDEEASGTVSYEWDFGDGTAPYRGPSAVHRFAAPGNYTLVLTGRNGGSTDRQRLTVAVADEEPPPAVASRDTASAPAPPADSAQGGGTPTVRFSEVRFSDAVSSEEEGTQGTGSSADAQEADAPTGVSVSCSGVSHLNAMYFEANSSRRTEEGQAALEENVAVLRQCPRVSIRLNAYAASDERRAQELAAARARVVGRFYRENGIADDRILESDLVVAARPMGKAEDEASVLRQVATMMVLRSSAADASTSSSNE